jgi:hypothetical protein
MKYKNQNFKIKFPKVLSQAFNSYMVYSSSSLYSSSFFLAFIEFPRIFSTKVLICDKYFADD